MLNNNPFYFDLTSKYISFFGTIFNDINIERFNSSGERVQLVKVPVAFTPKEKMQTRVEADPDIGRPYSTIVPRIQFEISNFKYDNTRQLIGINKNSLVKPTDKNKKLYQFNFVPYVLTFDLYIYVNNMLDGYKVLEQILPFFTPKFSAQLKLIEEINEYKDIEIVIKNNNFSDNYDIEFEKSRVITWQLTFDMSAYYFGPIKEIPRIKFANTNFYLPKVENMVDAVGNTTVSERLTVRPGLTANGEPTSNLELSVPLSQIDVDDNYGYVVIIENDL